MPALTSRAPPASVSPPRLRAGRADEGRMAALPVWPLGSAAPPPNTPFVAVVPGAAVPIVRLDLPAGLRGDARETVGRRQVLDQLGLKPQQMEIRPAPLCAQGALWQAMLVAAPADLARWREEAAPLGRTLRAVLPDYLCLPSAQGIWTIQTGPMPGDPVQMRLGPEDGLSAEADLAALTLTRAAQAPAGLPRAILRLGPALPVLDAALEALRAQHPGLALAYRAEDLPNDLPRPARFAHGELTLDLARQQPDARTALQAQIRGLVLPAAILILAGVIWTIMQVLEVQRLEQRVQVQQDQTEVLVRQHFLPQGPLPDIRLQVLRLLDDRRAGLDATATASGAPRPLTRMRQASAVLANADIRLDAMRLQADGSVVMDLTSPDFTTLETLITDLRAAGLEIIPERSASDGEGAVLATISLLPGPAAGERP